MTYADQLKMRDCAEAFGLYDPADERDACGVGLIVALDGTPRREIVDLAIKSLKAVWHRGAVDADGKTGDGAGVRLNVPQALFRDYVARTGHAPAEAEIGVGQLFLPRTDFAAQDAARAIVEAEILREGLFLYGWRQTPVDASVLGDKANLTRPAIEQILFFDPQERDRETLARTLYTIRRRIEKRCRIDSIPDLYVCSLSTDDIVYKGMFLAESIDRFYPDLRDPRFASRVAIFHQRYSTNTFPQWRLAQPFRMLAHNGEINTLRGNINWMRSHEIRMASAAFEDEGEDLRPIIQPGASDSAALDQVFELIVRAGRAGPMAKCLLMPEAWSKRSEVMKTEHRALYEYCNAVMEPWDGPAALSAYDGRWALAGLDRNGLRPMRYSITSDNVLAVGSETGMCPLDPDRVVRRGALEAGGMLAFDFDEKRLYGHGQILDRLSSRHPYKEWLENIVELEPMIGPGPEPVAWTGGELRRRQAAAGYSLEEIDLVLKPMATEAKEAVGSMGDDTPLAVLSDRYRPLSHYLRQKFSQVTNPPIDPLREARVMSLKTRFKNLGNILVENEAQTSVFVLESPFLSNGMFDRFVDFVGAAAARIDCTYPAAGADGSGKSLSKAIARIRRDAVKAVSTGAEHVILSDEAVGPDRVAAPMILAAAAAHTHLVNKAKRAFCSIIVRSAECVDPHYAAMLVAVGATAVNPYLACDSISELQAKGALGSLGVGAAILNYKKAIETGLMKILAKAGISVISSYRGGCNFEALGISRALAREYFPGAAARISGIGMPFLERKTREIHAQAYQSNAALPVGGFYRQRRRGEAHALEASIVADLQRAVRNEDYDAYKAFVAKANGPTPFQLRDLLGFRPLGAPRDVSEVESINAIRQRFVTPGMSLGALSPEAHGALNIAMNRIGAKSVSGEGGEDPARYKPYANGDNANSAVKQIASGRFGVTTEYLNQCREIEIKVAQGAKPGEGGQLPGFKVTEFIARMRHSTPGVTLISPPPHHDIYSIEDLAQLIYDLKNVSPSARVCVKLVSAAGIGTIAAGVAKANADVILVSGNVGGTGASALTSIKFAGGPWELGLSEAHQVLTVNNLREKITLRTDGGIRTGRDVVIAAMLGAEEFGIGTTSLVAMGCLMVRQCHSNTCPVGVCTQDENLRARFPGKPEHVVALMSFIAEDVRETLASIGASSIEDVIGRSDLLYQETRGAPDLDDLDLNPMLTRVDAGGAPKRSTRIGRSEPTPTLDDQILKDAAPTFERGEKMQLTYSVRNTQRSIGARTSSAIIRQFGRDALPEGQLTVRLRGSAGQSLGCFAATGLRLELVGDANDYVGKGLSGGIIVVRPSKRAMEIIDPAYDDATESDGGAIIGNTCLYGATAGALYAAGRAGTRFAVRNSGADAVIEGCGANGCEYMTGGEVAILGPVGDNFAAGMTGGRAYVYDPEKRLNARINPDNVIARPLGEKANVRALALIERHFAETRSAVAEKLLTDWTAAAADFVEIAPVDILPLEEGAEAAA
ncbi:MAG: glutamate synthase large subunit [Alphaproteobacteria bacterium]|nr:glutamate synthase large subunit [Alphaproteobacteria bacterium]